MLTWLSGGNCDEDDLPEISVKPSVCPHNKVIQLCNV